MATVKVVIHKRKNKDGSQPLMLRLTKNRKSSYIFFNKRIFEKDWNTLTQSAKRTHPNYKRLNNYLRQLRTDAENLILDFERDGQDFTLEDLKVGLNFDTPNPQDDSTAEASVFKMAENYFSMLKEAGNYNRLTSERPAINHFKRFLKGKDILFSEIKISTLERFKAYLTGKVRASDRTVANYLIILRTLYKRAIKDELVDKAYYPFGKDKFQIKKPESQKIGLNEEEIRKLENLDLPKGSFEHHARNVWLYSFYFAGMRASDVLLSQWSDFKDDRLFYVMGKNKKPGSLKIPGKALAILDQYFSQKRGEDDLVFPDCKNIEDFTDKERVQRRLKEVIRRINTALKTIAAKTKINKKLTMHIARHSFGNISGDKIPIQMLQKLYRHSSITTTVNYQKNFLLKDADDALDSVLDF